MNIGESRPGKRLPDGSEEFKEGEYAKEGADRWWAWPPGGFGLASIRVGSGHHHVDEHEDGTITVQPSIRWAHGAKDGGDWHGFLERGVWRRVP